MRLTDVPADMVEAARQTPDAFEPLFEAIASDLYALCQSILQNHDDAEEVFQESMLRIYRHLPALRDPGAFGAWSIRLVVHACRSLQAKNEQLKRLGGIGAGTTPHENWDEQRIPAMEAASHRPGPRAAAEDTELGRAVSTALSALPPRQREAILLFELRAMSLTQVAEIMDCSPGAVKFHLHEARRKLREALRCYVPAGAAP